jgi:hypothetical protein
MRPWVLVAALVAALSSAPVVAGPPPHVYARPYVSFGYSFGYPGFGFYGPQLGVGVQIVPRPAPPPRQEGERGAQPAFKLYIYPAAGQSEAQTAEDRYQCHVWAADQSGHDPTLGAGSRDEAESYTRAFTACMEGRRYVVK